MVLLMGACSSIQRGCPEGDIRCTLDVSKAGTGMGMDLTPFITFAF